MEKFELNLRERNIPKERLLEDLKRVAYKSTPVCSKARTSSVGVLAFIFEGRAR
jgi:hypothetical protein